MTMKSMCFLGCLVLALGMAAPALAGELNDSEEPGSVLVFYEFRSGTILTPDQGVVPRSRFSISATCPPHDDPTTCADMGQNIRLEAHWVCPGDGFSICNEVDFNLGLTVNGTLVFDATGLSSNGLHGLVPVPACDRGYLIAWVVNDSGQAIKFDGLIGKAVVRDNADEGLDGLNTLAVAYNPLPIQAIGWKTTGDPTDDSGEGSLDFGTEYKGITGRIYGTIEYENENPAGPDNDLEVTFLTLDVKSNKPNEATFVDLKFFSEDEQMRSGGVNFTCWGKFKPSGGDSFPGISGGPFDASFSPNGIIRSESATQSTGAVTLVGLIRTVEGSVDFGPPFRAYAYPFYNDSNVVHTTFCPRGCPGGGLVPDPPPNGIVPAPPVVASPPLPLPKLP